MGTSTDMESEAANWQFPKLAGSHLHLENPALEFIKSVCTVFALDVSVDHQVLVALFMHTTSPNCKYDHLSSDICRS